MGASAKGRRLLRLIKGLAVAAAIGAAVTVLPETQAQKQVSPFLIYYGGIPAVATPAAAGAMARSFSGYPVVVFGNAWRAPAFAGMVKARLPGTRFFGYADTGHVTLAHVLGKLSGLEKMHFSGVLLDEAGIGLSQNPAMLRAIVQAAHRDGLAVMLNAWMPQVALSAGLKSGRDGVLCENWVYSDGAWRTPRASAVYLALRQLERSGIVVYMGVTTKGPPQSAKEVAGPVIRTIYWEMGSFVAVSDENYSATSDAVFPAGALKGVLGHLTF